ncbi:MAG: ATP synthase F1 subunit delta [Planctomycetaceae bacterium]
MSAQAHNTTSSHVLADPSAKAVAKVYAQAYLDAAKSAGVDNPLEDLTSFHDDVLRPNPEFARLLTSEVTNRDEKVRLIDRTVGPVASEFFTNYLRVLARHERLDLLPLILAEAWTEQERREGRRRVQLISSQPLSDEQLGQIRDRLAAALQFEPVLLTETDESLIGGLVIRVGDTIFDGSLRARLKDLRHRLRERYLHEIQSGRDRFSSPEGN